MKILLPLLLTLAAVIATALPINLPTVAPTDTDSALLLQQKQLEGIRRLSGDTLFYQVTPTLTNSSYASNAVMGQVICLTNLVRGNMALLRNLTVVDRDNTPFDFAVIGFLHSPTNITGIDGTAIAYGNDATNKGFILTSSLLYTNRFLWESSGSNATLIGAQPLAIDYPLTSGVTNGYLAIVYKGTASRQFTNAPSFLFVFQK